MYYKKVASLGKKLENGSKCIDFSFFKDDDDDKTFISNLFFLDWGKKNK